MSWTHFTWDMAYADAARYARTAAREARMNAANEHFKQHVGRTQRPGQDSARRHQGVIEMKPCTHCGAWAADFPRTEFRVHGDTHGAWCMSGELVSVPDPVKRCPCRLVAS